MRKRRYNKSDLKRLIKKYLNIPGITNIEIGEKYKGGRPQNSISIRFHVRQKIGEHALPKNIKIPKTIGGYKTDVLQRHIEREIRTVSANSAVQPLLGGIEIQNATMYNGAIGLGTLGGILNIENTFYGITNYHVLFGDSSIDEAPDHLNNKIIQPGKPMQGRPIGKPYPIYNDELDYALIEFADGIKLDRTQDINRIDGLIQGYSIPYHSQKVFKCGAVTGVTFGIVEGISLTDSSISIRPDTDHAQGEISQRGDSGAIWFDATSISSLKPVALHYGKDTESKMVRATSFGAIYASIRNRQRNLTLPPQS